MWFSDVSELAKVSTGSDMVLGVSVTDAEVEPSEVWQTFCGHVQPPGVSRLWYTGSEKPELELQGLLGLSGRGMNCCGREYLISAGKEKHEKHHSGRQNYTQQTQKVLITIQSNVFELVLLECSTNLHRI